MVSIPIQNVKKNRAAYRKALRLSTRLPAPIDTARLGRQIVRTWPEVHVWLLRGHLGAGKTTLVRGILRALGVRRAVTSPTFTLSKEYRLRRRPWRNVVHVDAYRLRRRSESAALQIEELAADPMTLLLVEWPERLPGVRWGAHGTIRLSHRSSGRRAEITLGR